MRYSADRPDAAVKPRHPKSMVRTIR
jgi:hypothetical protein